MEFLTKPKGFEEAVTEAVRGLVSVRHEASGSFIDTPLMYPSGGSVVVWVRREEPHYFVSDFGFAFKECVIMGADRRQYVSRAEVVAEAAGVNLGKDGAFEVLVSEGQLKGAIKAVANCAQETTLRFAHRIFQRRRADVGTIVQEKLIRLFGKESVARDYDFEGASHSHWHIDVAVKRGDDVALFDTVTPWAQSVAFTLAKFGDIRLLDDPPQRVTVLAAPSGYGNWLTALAQNSTILKASAETDAYKRATRLH